MTTDFKTRYKFNSWNGIAMEETPQKYEISTGTFREDLIDFNIIKMINGRRAKGLSVDFFEIEAATNVKSVSKLVATILEKTKADLAYSVHTKQNAELYGPDIIVAVSGNFDVRSMKIDAYGSPEAIEKYGKIFRKAFKNKAQDIKMSWFYSSGRGFDSTDIPIDSADINMDDSYYPFLEGGVDAYLERYHTSKNAILLLTGEPGTGKTSFIRYYLSAYNLDSIVTYDEQVMQRDDFYINFLTNQKRHVLIVEDADLLLAARDDGENKIMSKFLNVSDGLVKALNKKIIFSTNITQLSKIDSAITRPGRCFDVVEFRKLTKNEANAICEKEDLPLLEENRDYTLADIFNRNTRNTKVRKMGII